MDELPPKYDEPPPYETVVIMPEQVIEEIEIDDTARTYNYSTWIVTILLLIFLPSLWISWKYTDYNFLLVLAIVVSTMYSLYFLATVFIFLLFSVCFFL